MGVSGRTGDRCEPFVVLGADPGNQEGTFAVIRSRSRVQLEDPGEPAEEPEEESADPGESEDPDQPSDPRPSTWIATAPPSVTRTFHTTPVTETISTTPVTGIVRITPVARTAGTSPVARTIHTAPWPGLPALRL
ncbi:hypothetical protein GCM10009555_021370 [Acrocarpospora macrocephala]|uniref:Uncharacterized protein n=1 Tax=Acrocarpospora macrocephala TaxID=150177 RepID=A0A5M3WLS5_9ACTN|nr:hypothetical protein Amac_014580 [Acrocarpospora macrocephala]